ncbi:MAG: hypothetical protein K8S00_11155, partial [Bacteroidales bacterium]|nr:hypothetical protein [Bacteroidales bacterium]
RDIDGNVISDQQISLKINLIQGSKTGQAVYSEIHDLKTNKFGLINLEMGMGKNKTGEISSINWGLSKYFVNIEIDIKGGNNYESIGVSQLLSVPYALYAETSGGTTKAADSWTDAGSVTYLTNTGYDVGIGTSIPGKKLVIYDSDATIRIDDSDGGGFTNISDIYGGTNNFLDIRKYTTSGIATIKISPAPLDGTSGALWEVFRSTNTTGEVSIRIYKGNGTGTENCRISGNRDSYFNINNSKVGIGTTIPTKKLFIYDSDATIRIDDSDGGGFTNISDIYGGANNFLDIRKYATSGIATIKISPAPLDGTSGALWEIFRSTNTTGEVSIRIYKGNGTGTLNSRISGNADSYFNVNAGNVGIGTTSPAYKLDVAGDINYTGDLRVSGSKLISLGLPYVNNTFVGLTGNTTNAAIDNTFLGYVAGKSNTNGAYNTFLGSFSGTCNTSGSNNTFIGHTAGATNQTGSSNVCLGFFAGPSSGNIDHKLYINHTSGTPLIYGDFNNVEVGIATTNPGTNLTVFESNTHLNPAFLIEQASTGDAAMRFLLTGGQSFSVGIDNSDNDNFRISSGTNLGSSSLYTEATTMMRIHTENTKDGIIDLNHQSRGRVYLNNPPTIPSGVWTLIPFDAITYDEHSEWIVLPGAAWFTFIATEDGYYQVNARTEFVWEDTYSNLKPWCSIAIYKNGSMYAQGNNLDLQIYFSEEDANNNAPNVSDVVYLQAGDNLEIYVYQNINFSLGGGNMFLKSGSSQTYCSIHKVS